MTTAVVPNTPTTISSTSSTVSSTTTTVGQTTTTTAAATGRVYYVDAASGNDSGSGTSPSSAWRTLAKVTSYATSPGFKAGDQVLLKRGQTWRERLVIDGSRTNGAANAPVVFGAYGTGDKPVISAGASLGNANQWSETSGHIWQTAAINSAYDLGMVTWADGQYGKKQSSALSSGNSQGDWYFNRTSHVLYLYSSSNPAAYYGPGLEASQKYDSGYSLQSYVSGAHSYLTFKDLAFKNQGYHAFVVGNGSDHITFDSCEFRNIGGGWDGGESDGYAIEVWAGITNLEVKYCTFERVFNLGVSLQSNGSGSHTWSHIYVHHNTFFRCCGAWEIWLAASGTQTANDIVYAHNVAYQCGGNDFQIANVPYAFTITGSTGGNVHFTNCKNVNNVWLDPLAKFCWVATNTYLSGWTIDYNDYHPVGSAFCYLSGDKSWTYWRGLGMDAHSLTVDPQLVDPDGGNFRLGSGSACAGAGTSVSAIGVLAPVNIGAY
jgi:hypothetical protein